jgi:hypothetical protein
MPQKIFRRRQDLVLSFLLTASNMRTEDIEQALSRITSGKPKNELSSWSRMIVPKKHSGEDG